MCAGWSMHCWSMSVVFSPSVASYMVRMNGWLFFTRKASVGVHPDPSTAAWSSPDCAFYGGWAGGWVGGGVHDRVTNESHIP